MSERREPKRHSAGGRPEFNRRRKFCKICKGDVKEKDVNYKNIDLLKEFLSDRGKISSRQRTGICAKHQRLFAREVKRARMIALLPFKVEFFRSGTREDRREDRREGRDRDHR